jgi:hypothetical protein
MAIEWRLWQRDDDWPINPINFVFLLEAADRIGRTIYRENWRKPPFGRDDTASIAAFDHVARLIAEACEAGTLSSSYADADGLAEMDRRYWHFQWPSHFVRGEVEVPFHSLYPTSHTIVCPIFVRQPELDQLILNLTATSAAMMCPKQERVPAKLGRAQEAIAALWADGVPSETLLPNPVLCTQVNDWLKTDCKARNLQFLLISNDTVLRAAGRKSKAKRPKSKARA